MGIAYAVRERANCRGYKVGAILILDGRIVSTGYNGTPENMPNCDEGGCVRCAERVRSSSGKPKFKSGTGYDICICVHAEQNALLAAARFGIPVAGGMIYSTLQPCFGCLKEMAQARIHGIRFRHPWSHPDQPLREGREADLHPGSPRGLGSRTGPPPQRHRAPDPGAVTISRAADPTGRAARAMPTMRGDRRG
ncbi:MAG: cytidine deaminase [candidate division NC10 bacterium]|nr:cytidine deaminase [candidate division NC10 bacterium]